MKIVEYNESYAAKVADMWNKSQESWGNDDEIKTDKDVIVRENESGNLKLYLAMDNDEVVGYCSFSEYQHDEGASYLPLLNVRPDYHGKKVGKMLILKVLEDAIASKWPRFDLFTWSGNIKAMPLYKKCGFFWERKYEDVHLMNFLPYLYQTEAFKKYLDQIDWYKDSKRKIDMEFDGDERGNHTYYKYIFSNENLDLAFEFEQTSRGLRYIDTPDYSLELILDQRQVVFNKEYNAKLKIINKKDVPLSVFVNGVNDKNIINNHKSETEVDSEQVIDITYYVEELKEKQDDRRTFPSVSLLVSIDDMPISMKMGVDPKNPLEMKMHIEEYNHLKDKEYVLNLDLENNLDTEEIFYITLKDNQIATADKISVLLKPKQKRSIQVPYKVLSFGYYSEKALVEYQDEKVYKNVDSFIKGSMESFTGLSDTHAYIISGNFTCAYDIEHKRIVLFDKMDSVIETVFMAPQVGLPFSLEFSNKKPSVEFVNDNQMKVVFTSSDFENVQVILHVKHIYGILSLQFELLNKGNERNLALCLPIWKQLGDSYVPYMGRLHKNKESNGSGIGSYDFSKIDETWMYNYKHNIGFSWHKDEPMNLAGWKISSTKQDINLSKNESYLSKEFFISLVHPNVEEFRRFAGYKNKKEIVEMFDMKTNSGNPFTKDKITYEFVNHKKNLEFKGEMTIDGSKTSVDQSLTVEPGLNDITLDVQDRIFKFKRQTFKIDGVVKQELDGNTYIVDNGVLTYKADNTYSDSIYSLVVDGEEWLDSNYPDPKERVWWGVFSGGINLRSNGLQDTLALKEKRTTDFITLQDNFGNEWKGIKQTLEFNIDEKLKGLTYESYVVTLPGLPLVHNFSKIINNSGKKLTRKGFFRFNTLKADEDKTNVRFNFDGVTYKCGDIYVDRAARKLLTIESTRKNKLAVYNKENELLMETQKGYTILFSEAKVTVNDEFSTQIPGDFLFFTKDTIKKDYLKDLENIKFEV